MPTVKRLVVQLRRLESTTAQPASRVLITPHHGSSLDYQIPSAAVVAYQLARAVLMTQDGHLIPVAVKDLGAAGFTLEKVYNEKRRLVAAAICTEVGKVCFYQPLLNTPGGFKFVPYQKTSWLHRIWRRLTA